MTTPLQDPLWGELQHAAHNLAIVYYAQGRTRETIEFLEKSQALRPDPETLRMLETLYQLTGTQPAAE